MPVTARETLVAEAVLDLATRRDQEDVLLLLHDLTAYTVSLLGLRGAGTAVLNGAGRVDRLTASDELCGRLQEDQFALGEGPCLDSARAAGALAPVALGPGGVGAVLWPRFAPRAVDAGICGVAVVPLRTGRDTHGAVTLMAAVPEALSARAMRLAQVLADAVGAWLGRRTKDEITEQLETALNTRDVIEQAKGALAARLEINVHDAFRRLHSHARSRQQRLGDVAGRVVNGSVPPELTERPPHAGR
ncbi:transcriptional regulator [Streptomyces longispororuber]|uniref:Transcriptional regulator n=1 Tax=Streptomyces longispororuber TaxID=68230 RepID=A0A919AEZ4_9ACTN|nr:GAF and ANTAR domain-containing protein [Streptomyces longispororuber]GHF01578.1 transcriptional regulator [Streptomyces longispororuber]